MNIILNTNKLLIIIFLILNFAHASDRHAYQVSAVKDAGVLHLRTGPGVRYNVIMELPSDARWIIKRNANSAKGVWQKVVWGNKEGWVNTRYLGMDGPGSQELEEHRQCVASNPGNSICCGYPKQTSNISHLPEIETFSVTNVPKGESLNVRQAASGKSEAIATIPHNAVGIIKFPRQKSGVWQKVRWNGRDGWVNSKYLQYDPIISEYRNAVRAICH